MVSGFAGQYYNYKREKYIPGKKEQVFDENSMYHSRGGRWKAHEV